MLAKIEPAISALHEAVVGFTERELRMEIKSFGGINSELFRFPQQYSERLIAKGRCRFVIASAEIVPNSVSSGSADFF